MQTLKALRRIVPLDRERGSTSGHDMAWQRARTQTFWADDGFLQGPPILLVSA